MEHFISVISPLVPKRLKESIKRGICGELEPEDYFRSCSPATPPELAQCIFELHMDRLLEGRCYYEFGIFRGYTLWFVQDMIRRLGVRDCHCHAFDSFAGLPDPTGIDEGAPWSAGEFAVRRDRVEEYLRDFNADFSRISLHEGFFSDELFAHIASSMKLPTAALVLVDCDLYSSTVPVLRFIADYLGDGTILLFDDYNCFNAADDRGQRRALTEFLASHPNVGADPLRPFGRNGQGFRIRRSDSTTDVRKVSAEQTARSTLASVPKSDVAGATARRE